MQRSYPLKQRWEVQVATQLTDFRAFSLWTAGGGRGVCSPSAFFSSPLCVCVSVCVLCGPISDGNCLSLLFLSWYCSGGWEDATLCLWCYKCPVHNHCGVASPLTSTPCCCSCARRSALSFFSSSIWKNKRKIIRHKMNRKEAIWAKMSLVSPVFILGR